MANDNLEGLDLARTIEYYSNASIKLPKTKEGQFDYPIIDKAYIPLSELDLTSLFQLFPKPARRRSILREVICKPCAWFHKNSTSENPIETFNVKKALSETAIVTAKTEYNAWAKDQKNPSAEVILYQLPENISEDVQRIILSQGFVHELAHTIITPALHLDNYIIKLPDCSEVGGKEFIDKFQKEAENYKPISHYASTYRGKDNKFTNPERGVPEELAEAITAYLLRFSFREGNCMKPFADRPEIKELVKDFLYAKRYD
ncbi:MAG: hypothetical protein WC413_02990 [Candidatus Nanoarchaeia archaeon]